MARKTSSQLGLESIMLKEIINILRTEKTPISLDGLSQRLDIEKRALEGMLTTLIQKGLINKDKPTMRTENFQCGGFACNSCAASSHCPFTGREPLTYYIGGIL